MKIVGITGGIGSGKSVVARSLQALGYPIYDADARAKALMVESAELRAQITDIFGEAAYLPDGGLHRVHLSEQAFSNPDLLQQLNAVVHPATGRDFYDWTQAKRKTSPKPLLFKEAAILFESGAYLGCDLVVTVYAPKPLRVQRVVARDSSDPKAVAARMARQWPELRKLQRADFAIFNDGQHHLLPQIREMLQALTPPDLSLDAGDEAGR